MCGIFGEFSQALIPRRSFEQINNLNVRRGPDATGYWTNNRDCQLGFRRLAILDLSPSGNQPMMSSDGKWAMVFNGEIYNFRDLQQTLGIADSDLRSRTDSEVLVRAFENWGMGAVEKLNGMFAIALYNEDARQIHLIRDFAGIKPLYYGIRNRCVVFGSQFNQVFEHPRFRTGREVNKEALTDYVRLGYIPAPGSFFEDVYQVEPGQIVTVDVEFQVKKQFYYYYRSSNPCFKETSSGALDKFTSVFSGVIRRQLVSDVPIGTFLSGGIDSPLVTASAFLQKRDVESFTVGTDDERFDETAFAQQYASFLGINNHLHKYSVRTLLEQLGEHFKAYPEPFGDYSSLPSYQLCRMAREHFTVALSGDGGDEVFWGYPRMLNTVTHYPWFKYPKPIRRWSGGILRRVGKRVSYGINFNSIGEWVLEQQSQNKNDALVRMMPHKCENSDFIKNLYRTESFASQKSLLNWLRWNEFYGHLQRVLIKMDRASMYHSLEVRVPFLDKELLEFSLSVEPELGMTHEVPKYILKTALGSIFPEHVISQRKMGFSVQIDQWLRNELKDEVLALLVDRDPYPHNTFDREVLGSYVGDFMKGLSENAWGVWILYALQKWSITFNVA